MNLFNPSNNNLDEVVFEQRNKAYGAYAIRKAYPTTINKSMALTIGPMLFVLLGGIIWNQFRPLPPLPPMTAIEKGNKPTIHPITEVLTTVTGFTFILDNPLNFEIVIDKKVAQAKKKVEIMKPIETVISSGLSTGLTGTPNIGSIGLPGGIGGGSPGGIGTAGGDGPSIIELVAEVMPLYPGGADAMYEYIRKNLNYPRLAIDNSISGKVVISFVIMPDGSVQMPNVERGIGFGCDDEALRVVSNMPNWEPARQNGRKVPIRMYLPVVFQTVN
ncbi:MAG: hypothetical protein CFE21_09485 [Bacteroidetes bacterium B1(2017)]|nr:MAG: hypothetical protein CFE21_09485 [Bacteroidetes bacterium B1(2017)]